MKSLIITTVIWLFVLFSTCMLFAIKQPCLVDPDGLLCASSQSQVIQNETRSGGENAANLRRNYFEVPYKTDPSSIAYLIPMAKGAAKSVFNSILSIAELLVGNGHQNEIKCDGVWELSDLQHQTPEGFRNVCEKMGLEGKKYLPDPLPYNGEAEWFGGVLGECIQLLFLFKDGIKAGVWTAKIIQRVALKGGGIGGFFLEVASDIEKGSNILRIFMADSDGAVVVKDAAELEKLKTVTAESEFNNCYKCNMPLGRRSLSDVVAPRGLQDLVLCCVPVLSRPSQSRPGSRKSEFELQEMSREDPKKASTSVSKAKRPPRISGGQFLAPDFVPGMSPDQFAVIEELLSTYQNPILGRGESTFTPSKEWGWRNLAYYEQVQQGTFEGMQGSFQNSWSIPDSSYDQLTTYKNSRDIPDLWGDWGKDGLEDAMRRIKPAPSVAMHYVEHPSPDALMEKLDASLLVGGPAADFSIYDITIQPPERPYIRDDFIGSEVLTMSTTINPPLWSMETYPVRYLIKTISGRYIEPCYANRWGEVLLIPATTGDNIFRLLGKTGTKSFKRSSVIYLFEEIARAS